MKPIIKVENVSKQYRIGAREESYQTLRDSLAAAVRSPLRRLRGGGARQAETIWALKDVSFEVRPGEVLGLIGRNGAGKSTLLKILSRITEPTEGRIELYGRLGSLLEVGTGFHPELTGRENVYLSGAIMGMTRAEIDRKLDAVIAFSGVEKFIDTPVKRYSSGMYVRLAFAVAAHMEPEIMLVDEVLAVGDVAFQQKCLEHMKRLKSGGMTILLVSHNMSAIQGACERAIYLDGGRVAAEGHPADVVKYYREDVQRRKSKIAPSVEAGRRGSGVSITGCEMSGSDGVPRRDFHFGAEVRVRISLLASRRIELPMIAFAITRADGVLVCNFNNWYDNVKLDYIEGDCTLEGWLPPLRLVPGYYGVQVLVFPPRRSASGEGDLSRLQPLAVETFGDFSIEGPPLTEQDGIFQEPARKWVLTRADRRVEFTDIDAESVLEAYAMPRRESLAP
jgi:lipopolysaccharide transport system ATP-binding protein